MQIYEIKVSYQKWIEDGGIRQVTESYLVEADRVLDIEEIVEKQLRPYVLSGDISIDKVSKMKISGIVLGDEGNNYFYKAKVEALRFDEKAGNMRKVILSYIIMSEDFHKALLALDKFFGGSLEDYKVLAIQETAIVEYLQTPATA